MNRRAAFALSFAALLAGACGSTTTSTDTASDVAITAAADPVTAVASTDLNYQWAATATVTLTERAGVGVLLAQVNTKLEQAAGGIVVVSGTPATYKFDVQSPGG